MAGSMFFALITGRGKFWIWGPRPPQRSVRTAAAILDQVAGVAIGRGVVLERQKLGRRGLAGLGTKRKNFARGVGQ